MHLILLGAPGSGKGTYAVAIKEHYSIPHISTGEIFRKEIASNTELGILANSFIEKGHFVPDDVTIEIVRKRLIQDDCKNGFILDGYPRTIKQAEDLDEFLPTIGKKIDYVLNFEISDEEVIKRIVNRRACPVCRKGYNIVSLPPKEEGICDVCKTPLIQRDDDNEDTVKERLVVYYEQTAPLIDYYHKKELIVSINSEQPIDKVVEEIIVNLEAK